ncbi:MAG: nodulation protein NfeD [Deltaproteobacteria bacterium]|nr:nodulation protein NfeD [Deltaproteobacteria bacterium]
MASFRPIPGIRFWCALLLVALGLGALSAGGAAREAAGQGATGSHVNLIVINGGINPAVNDYIRDSIQRAHAGNARALIIQLDTPGGLLSSTRSIVKEMLSAPLPVIVYVAPSGAGAGSAGVFITLAANVAAMAPGTNIGAAHPVAGGGQEVKGVMGEKIENFTASFSETIAQRRGRDTEFAIQAVRRSISITDKEALEKRVIDIIAVDVSDLLKQAHGREVDVAGTKRTLDFDGVSVLRFEMGLKLKVLNVLADPNIAYLLMMAGILGLYMEFSNPGALFPGIAGGIALLLALASLQVLPINYAGLLLIGLGMCLLVAEAFLPSFGLLGISGVVSLGLGSLLLFDVEGSDLTVDPGIVLAAVGTLSAAVLVVTFLVVKSQRRRATLGYEGLLGEVGEVRERLDLKGRVFVHGEVWNAEGAERLEPGDRIEVVGHDGMVLKVKRAVES